MLKTEKRFSLKWNDTCTKSLKRRQGDLFEKVERTSQRNAINEKNNDHLLVK
jgi:hypothetical protein